MSNRILLRSLVAAGFMLGSGGLLAASDTSEPIFGSQLMTQQERVEQRTRMQSAKTAAEREQIRAEHHEKMQKRAAEQGVTLPAEPPQRGAGAGRGMGPGGGGMGPGQGGCMGGGQGMGPGCGPGMNRQ